MRDLLILGTRADPHNSWIEADLRDLGAQRVFLADFRTSLVEIHVDEAGKAEVRVDGETLRPGFLVWDRGIIQAGSPYYLDGDDPAEVGSRAFAAEEWRTVYRLLCTLSG